MRILITGAAGFIGSTLADTFIEAGHDVWGIDNFSTGRWENFERNQGWELHDTELEYWSLREDQPRTDLIIHCAASYKDPDDWSEDVGTNVRGGVKVSRLAKTWGAHLIYFQTILPPVSSYAISKIAAEQYMRLSGVDLTVLRLANIYGPRNLSGPIPVFYKRITAGLPCVVVDTARDMVFIDDLVDAVVKVVTGRLTGTFDVCAGTQTSILGIFESVACELDHYSIPPLIPPAPDDVQGTVHPDAGVPGWRASTGLRNGIAETIASYREHGVNQTHTHLRIGEKDAS